ARSVTAVVTAELVLGAGTVVVNLGKEGRGSRSSSVGARSAGRGGAGCRRRRPVVARAVMVDRDSGADRAGDGDRRQADLQRARAEATADRRRSAAGQRASERRAAGC